MPTKQPEKKPDYEQLGRMLHSLYETGYTSPKQVYKMSLIKGILGGFGGVIGATIVVAIFVWILSLFSDVPLIDGLRRALQTR